MFQRILIAWDGSALAQRALDAAIDLARRYEAELVTISVANAPPDAETAADRDESAGAARRYLTETFEAVRDRATGAGVSVEHIVVESADAAGALAGYAHDHGFDLVVCGHHRSGRAGRLLLRGISDELLRRSSTPLLIVVDDPA
jgi:nucleotide-binding universal stress UspA family protein